MFRPKWIYFSFIVLAVIFQASAGIFFKYAAITLAGINLASIMSNLFYILALVCMFLQAVVWQQALIYYPLSYAYPFISMVSFVVLIASAVLFQEGITMTNILGLVLISVGITIVSRKATGHINT
ncbi:DMT family transporter [Methanolacinia paynteri]|uniref:hypothetical protein n=1 Tax=Methanolacinia paynteri TaxID=230356 RepID=UPI000693B984|nr:hypothetical protein [Methanolacinia paynteri]